MRLYRATTLPADGELPTYHYKLWHSAKLVNHMELRIVAVSRPEMGGSPGQLKPEARRLARRYTRAAHHHNSSERSTLSLAGSLLVRRMR